MPHPSQYGEGGSVYSGDLNTYKSNSPPWGYTLQPNPNIFPTSWGEWGYEEIWFDCVMLATCDNYLYVVTIAVLRENIPTTCAAIIYIII